MLMEGVEKRRRMMAEAPGRRIRNRGIPRMPAAQYCNSRDEDQGLAIAALLRILCRRQGFLSMTRGDAGQWNREVLCANSSTGRSIIQ
jgi:hypothetical protein